MIDSDGLINTIMSHALASGLFETVNGHEPKSAPGNGLTAAVWLDYIGNAPSQSGLQSTTGLIIFNVRIFQNMLLEPQDAIDPMVMAATDSLMTAYSGDFEFGGQIKQVDLLGSTGRGLEAQAGYLKQDSGKLFRVMTLTVPLIVNDIWDQEA